MNAISLYARPSADFDAKLAESVALLLRAAREFTPLTQASSLGAEDMVITDLIAHHDIPAPVFVLETGKLHAETLQLLGRLQVQYERQVDIYRPDQAQAAAFVAEHGQDAMYQSVELRKACCRLRKLVPLEQALAGKRGWITGLRREQSDARAQVEFIERQQVHDGGRPAQRVKLSPLARWTNGDVWHYIASHGVPYNALHDQFYPSIGCAPCTRAVTVGEDPRSGRWWWEQQGARECGLHVDAAASVIPIRATA